MPKRHLLRVNKTQRLSKLFSELFLNTSCSICDLEHFISHDIPLCQSCFQKLTWITGNFCLRCGVPFHEENKKQTFCPHCSDELPPFDLCRSILYYHDTTDSLIKAFKYGKNWRLSKYFSRLLFDYYQNHLIKFGHDVIIYIPSHYIKNFKRGFNQSYLLAKGLSNKTGIPCSIELIKKIKESKSQTTLHKEERKLNIAGVFCIDRNRETIKGKKLLIIDDIVTTGATVEEVSSLLREFSPALIHVLSLARTPLGRK
ncbi:MAG: ComF family protein [Nitrospinae bacterium]|nr:ComF family protein [Nitrospinota bacterium]